MGVICYTVCLLVVWVDDSVWWCFRLVVALRANVDVVVLMVY